jgi:ubiquinone/menaquinone biosynthesis C-methylase UbiE
MYPVNEYVGVGRDDPIRFYAHPVFGKFYRRRVELCLAALSGGEKVLEVGFGSGVAFRNLHAMYKEIHGIDTAVDIEGVTEFFGGKGISVDLRKGDVLNLPHGDNCFDSVLLISILEHLRPDDQIRAFQEVSRILKPGGQVVYGVPVDRQLMRWAFRLLGYDIRKHHFSTESEVSRAARRVLTEVRITAMAGPFGVPAQIYQIGHFRKPPVSAAGR